MAIPKITISLKDEVLESVDSRGERGEANRSGVISRDLDRYYDALKRARVELRKKLSEAEIAAIIDNLNGVWMAETVSITLLYANIEDAIELEELDKKWKIDGLALVEKLRSMSFIELCALTDAVERWWNRNTPGEDLKYSEALEG